VKIPVNLFKELVTYHAGAPVGATKIGMAYWKGIESMPALELIENFRDSGRHVAVVLNEYGALEGMITLHDVVEAIFGDIPATGQTQYEATQRADGSWLVDGLMQTAKWTDLLGFHDLPETETGNANTLGGFVMHQLGSIPKEGDLFEFHNHIFEVVDMDGMRVDKVMVKKMEPKPE